MNLICEYGFRELDVVRIYSGVFEFNLPSQRVLQKCGFEREAVLKSAVCKKGRIFDEIRYAKVIRPANETNKGSAEEAMSPESGLKPGSEPDRKQWYEALFENYGKKYDLKLYGRNPG